MTESQVTKPLARDQIYLKRQFDAEIIVLCVRWYITYKLSYRDLVAMMAERGVRVSHTTIMRWVQRHVPEFQKTLESFLAPGRYRNVSMRMRHLGV